MFKPADLIGIPNNPAGFDGLRSIARAAKAYHNLAPYPWYSPMTREWKTEERGPLPRCLPWVRHLVEQGATWLMGQPLTFRSEDSPQMSETLNETWTGNDMGRRSLPMAVLGALAGGVCLKWTYDESAEVPARIHVLDPSEHVRLYWDPMDSGQLMMARVQFPYYNPVEQCWYWFREDVTDELVQSYKPLKGTKDLFGSFSDPYQVADKADAFGGWEKDGAARPNPFGVINVWYLRNRDGGQAFGEGDLWAHLHVVDLINFTHDLAHKHNQKALDPTKAFIDLAPQAGDAPLVSGPEARVEAYETVDQAPSQGKVELMQPSAEMREPMSRYADELTAMVYEAVGGVRLRPEEITNNGRMTSAVMALLYAPLIAATEAKRKTYGEDGLGTFFERMSRGLANLGAPGWTEVSDVQIHWPAFLEKTPEEKMADAQRRVFLIQSGLSTRERMVREQAADDGVIDVDELLNETETQHADPAGLEKREEEPTYGDDDQDARLGGR